MLMMSSGVKQKKQKERTNPQDRTANATMTERHSEDCDPDASADSERLVINMTQFTPLNEPNGDKYHRSDEAMPVSSYQAITVEVAQEGSDLNDDVEETIHAHSELVDLSSVQQDSHRAKFPVIDYQSGHSSFDIIQPSETRKQELQKPRTSQSFLVHNILPLSTDRDFSQQLPNISSILNRSSVTPNFQGSDHVQSHQIPMSFWDTPEYAYTLDTTYAQSQSESSATISPFPSFWSSYHNTRGHAELPFQVRDTMPAAVAQDDQTQRTATSDYQEEVGLPKNVTDPEPDDERKIPPVPQRSTETVKPARRTEKKAYQRYPKPPYSYAAMSIMAIENSPSKCLQYREIAEAIRKMFPPYFSGEYQGWRRSVRHMLSRLDCFICEKAFDGARNCFHWKVDLTKVNPEWFMRQAAKEDLRKTDHEYKLYLHQELGVPPIILPDSHCMNDSVSTASDVSRAVRNVLFEQQADDVKVSGHELTSRLLHTRKDESSTSDHDVILPSKPSNFRLGSVSTLVTDTDDFLGARTHTSEHSSSETIPKFDEDTDNDEARVEDRVKDLGLPTYILDSPIASPIPHDVYRDVEGTERYCPSVDSSHSSSKSSETGFSSGSSSETTAKSLPMKRSGTNEVMKPKKKAKSSTDHQQPDQIYSYFNQDSVLQTSGHRLVHQEQPSSNIGMLNPSSDPSQQYPAAASPFHHSSTYEIGKPLCWPPVDNPGSYFPLPGQFPIFSFGSSTEQFPWYHQSGFPYHLYGYPTYDSQYGVNPVYGHQQFSNEASRLYRYPYDGAMNLSVKPDC